MNSHDHPKELLVLPRRLGWGWRLNFRHRFAWPFLILQIAFVAAPLLVLRALGVQEDDAYAAAAIVTIGISIAVWFILARKPA